MIGEERYTEVSTEMLERMDKQFVWHPFTQMQDWLAEEPLIVVAGEGNYLIDTLGRRYLDGVSSLWVNLHGHRRPEIDQAIVEQLNRIAHSTALGLTNPPAIELAQRLVEVSPKGLSKVFYSDNGSTAVEIGMKMAYQYWQQQPDPQPGKTRFMSFTNGYHGDTLGAVSVGGIDLFHSIYGPLLMSTVKVNSPYCYRCHLGKEYPACDMSCLGEVEEALERHHEELAAIVMEPLVQAAAGMLVSPPGYTCRVRDLASKYGVLFIADEVATGFGHTGNMFACEHEGVEPDFMAVAKGITGGYLPLAATLATQEIFDAFCGRYEEQKTFYHGHTYTGNALACAAALASLKIFETDDVLGSLQGKISFLETGLQEFWKLKHVGDIRQLGVMVGIELVRDADTREPFPYESKTAIKVIQEARCRGLVIRPLGDVLILMPPLSITDGELENLLSMTFDSIKAVTEG
jgi:adenosylmethionine-8-amino-7-oxononanoate aminotransferase